MEKVTITQEQANWLERFELSQTQIDYYIDIHSLNKRPDSPVADWTTSKLARALYIGYEVEKNFEVGDWVVVDGYSEDYDEKVLELTKIYKGARDLIYCKFYPSTDSTHNFCLDDTDIRHATPEEIEQEKGRRWWEKHGRDVWELKVGDIMVDKNDTNEFKRISDINNLNYERDISTIKDLYNVACFVEDRKDVKG